MNIFAINAGTNAKTLSKTENTRSCSNEDTNLFSIKNSAPTEASGIDIKENYTIEMASMISLSSYMTDNVQILNKLNANGLTSIALQASSKGFSIINSVRSAISSYSSQIASIANNPFLSDDEKKAQIKLLEAKIKACANEGTSKISDLYCISEVVVSLASTYTALEKSGFDTEEMISMFTKMLANVNTNPSDFSEAKDKKDLSNIVKENDKEFFGPNASHMFSEYIEKTDKKIKENEEKLKSKKYTPDEEERFKLELVLYKSEKNLFSSLAK